MRTKKFERSIEGLRDALMSELEDIREGLATPAEAQSFAFVAKQIISSMEMEITERIRQDAKEERALKRKEREEDRLRLERETTLRLSYIDKHDDGESYVLE